MMTEKNKNSTDESTNETTVSLKVVHEFIDKTNGEYRKPTQQPFEATHERAKELIELGFCVEVKK